MPGPDNDIPDLNPPAPAAGDDLSSGGGDRAGSDRAGGEPWRGGLRHRARARVRKTARATARASVLLLIAMVFLGMAGAIGLWAVSGTALRLPAWVVDRAEARLNQALPLRETTLVISNIEVMIDRDWVPRLRLENLSLIRRGAVRGADFARGQGGAGGPGANVLLRLPEARVSFEASGLLAGVLRPSGVVLSGAALRLRRDAQGRFDLDLGGGTALRDLGNFPQMLDRLDALFTEPALAALDMVSAEALSLTLVDEMAGRTFTIGDGNLQLLNTPDEVKARLSFTQASSAPGESWRGAGAPRSPAQAMLSLATRKDSSGARLRAEVERVDARDLAAGAPVLGFLEALDAPISGRLITGLTPGGQLAVVEGELAVGAGALQPSPEARPIAFDGARLAFDFDPARERINLTALEVQSRTLRLEADGHVDAPGATRGFNAPLRFGEGDPEAPAPASALPDAFVAQIRLSQLMVDPEGLFTAPVRFGQGALDLRLRLDPFRLEVGQMMLQDGDQRILASGRARADAAGWQMAADLRLNRVGHERLLALWPLSVVPRTREWLVENVLEGTLENVKVALRFTQGQEPRFALNYDFHEGDARFIKTLPPIRRASGYATIEGQTYTMVVDSGIVSPPEGGEIDVAGSVFTVLDILHKPAQAEVRLRARSSLTAGLSLLDEPPFSFLTKAGRPVALGEGQAAIHALIRLSLVRRVRPEDVSYRVSGQLSQVRSEVLVPGRVLGGEALAMEATPAGLAISGDAALDGVPFTGRFWLPFPKSEGGRAEAEGTAALTPHAAEVFRLGLPKGALTGAAQAQFRLDLPKGAPAQLRLSSDLRGLGLRLPELGWSKPAATPGRLEVAAVLGKPAAVERLAISAPGLSAEGEVRLRANGQLDRLSLRRVQLGQWFEGPVTLIGRGAGQSPAVAVPGGRADLRHLPEFGSGAGGAGGGGNTPVSLVLDRVSINDQTALHNLRGEFATGGGAGGGFRGNFTAALDGTAAIRGAVAPVEGGTGVRIQSDDAGGVLAAAGIFSKARGGTLDLQLLPGGARGVFQGYARARNFQVRDAPVLAALLSAISVVGILEQLQGQGLVFSDGEAHFRLTPDGVEVQHGSAVGLSMGVTLAGVYLNASKRLEMQGVISPIYLLNGIGSLITRQGEGLFGFNYRLSGTSERPSVSVNPLSILTPGMFRDIFRRPVPRLR